MPRRLGPAKSSAPAPAQIALFPSDLTVQPDQFDSVLLQIARATWARRQGVELNTDPVADPPPQRVPSEDRLLRWLGDGGCPSAASVAAAERLAPVLESIFPITGTLAASPAPPQWGEISVDGRAALGAFTPAPDPSTPPSAVVSASYVHTIWSALDPEVRPLHPLAPLIDAWQARPVDAAPYQPKRRASLPRLDALSGADLLRLSAEAPRPTFSLPLLPEPPGDLPCSPWLLRLYAAAGGGRRAQGRGAPWDMRLFIGALLHVHTTRRDSTWQILSIPTDDVIAWLHPDGWNHRTRDWHRFPDALWGVHRNLSHVSVPGTGWVQIMGVPTIPKESTNPLVRFQIMVPRVAKGGARIDWPRLCRYGAESATLYRAYLSAMTFLARSAYRGQPLTRTLSRRAGGASTAVGNPLARYVRPLTDHQLTALIGLDPSSRKHRFNARAAFDRLEADQVLRIERAPGARGARLFGPDRASGA